MDGAAKVGRRSGCNAYSYSQLRIVGRASSMSEVEPQKRKATSQALEMPWLRKDYASGDSSCPAAESCLVALPSLSQTALRLSMDYSMKKAHAQVAVRVLRSLSRGQAPKGSSAARPWSWPV